jgi:hypothetical protein
MPWRPSSNRCAQGELLRSVDPGPEYSSVGKHGPWTPAGPSWIQLGPGARGPDPWAPRILSTAAGARPVRPSSVGRTPGSPDGDRDGCGAVDGVTQPEGPAQARRSEALTWSGSWCAELAAGHPFGRIPVSSLSHESTLMPPLQPSFASLGVPTDIVAALDRKSITEPFPIQSMTIPDALAGRDVCGKAPTGSGKTLAFGIGAVARLTGKPSRRGTRGCWCSPPPVSWPPRWPPSCRCWPRRATSGWTRSTEASGTVRS